MAELDSLTPAAVTSARVISSTLWSALSSLVSAPLLIVSTVITARILGVGDFGHFAYYTYLTTLLVGLADLGVLTALLRAGAHAAGRSDEVELMRLVRAGTTWSMTQIPVAVVIGWFVLPGRTAAALFALAMFVSFAFLGPSHYLVMTSSLKWASQVKLFSLLLSSAAMVSAAALSHDPAVTFAAGTLGANLPTVMLVLAVPKGRRLLVLRPGLLRLSRADAAFGFGALLHGQLNSFVFSRSEVLFFRPGQAAALGSFASAQTVSARSSLFIDVFYGAVPTALTSAQGKGEETLSRAFVRVSQAFGMLVAALSPLLLVGAATLAPLMFGHGFTGVAGFALALTLVSLLQSGMAPVLALRFAQRSIRPMILAGLVAAGADAGLAALLVPRLAAGGAVIANATSGVLYLALAACGYLRDARLRRPVLDHAVRTVLPLVAAGALAAPLLWLAPAVGAVVGIPLAAALAILLLRVWPLDTDARTALEQACPPALRRAVAVGLRIASGGAAAA